MLPGEAGARRRPRRRRTTARRGASAAAATASSSAVVAATSPDATTSTIGSRQGDAGRDRQPGPQRVSEADGLRAVQRLVVRLDQRHDCRSLEHRHVARVAVDPHARAVGDPLGGVAGADDAGDAVLPRDDRRVREQPPLSVTIAPSNGSRMLKASVVASVTQHVALLDAVEVASARRRAGRSLPYAPELAPRPRITVSSCASSETAEHLAHRGADAQPSAGPSAAGAPTGRASAAGRRPGAPGRPSRCRSCGRRAAPPARRPSASTLPRPARTSRRCPRTTKCSASWSRPRCREPTAGCERGPAHQPGRPDVAVDTALVAHAGSRCGPPRAVRRTPRGAPRERGCGRRRSAASTSGRRRCLVDRGADRAQEHVGQLERVVVRDVEPVEQPVADEVEVVVQRLAGRAGFPPQALEQGPGVLVGVEGLARGGVGAVRRDQRGVLRRATTGDQGRAAHQAEQLHRRQTGPLRRVGEEVARGDHRGAGERHVLPDHRDVVVAAAAQVGPPAPRRSAGRDRSPGSRGWPAPRPACGPPPTPAHCHATACGRTPPRRAGRGRGRLRGAPGCICP